MIPSVTMANIIDYLSGQAARIRNKYERGANYELGNSVSASSVSTMFGKGGDSINPLEEYNGFAWKCINIRAETLADQDLFVERLVGNKWQEDITHDFNAVLEGGDGTHDLSELLEAHSKSMDLFGESFWYFSKGEAYNKPFAVYLLDPHAMTVLVSGSRVTGYVYQKYGERIAFDIDEIEHYKVSNPRNPFRGYGPMQAAGWFVRSGRYVNTYVNNFLENNAIPAGVIVAKSSVDEKDWELFKSQWAEKYSGIDNSGKTGFVRGSDLSFVKTGMSLGDVDLEKIKNTTREDIMIMFGISKPMMAIFDDINRASAVTARQLFAINITSPALRRLKRKISKDVAKWYGPQFRIGSTNPIPEDAEAELNKYDKLLGRAFTINEVRAAYGKEPIPGGDVIDTAVKPVAPAKSAGKITIRTKTTGYSYEMKESFRSETENLQKSYELKLLEAANPVLEAQKKMVLAQIEPKKLLDSNFNPEDEASKLSDELQPILVELAKAQGALSIALVSGSAEFQLTPVMIKYLQDSIFKASLGFTKDTQDQIASALAEGLNNGESVSQISKRISAIYDDVLGVKTPGYRIERLARTEVIRSSNEITEAAYKQSGVVRKKEWFVNPGACQFCKALDGSIITLDSVYVPINGSIEGIDKGTYVNTYEDVKHPPIHPTCRCTLIPVIEGK